MIKCRTFGPIPYALKISNFRDRHVRDVIQIIEEGNEPLPRCIKCGIFQSDVGIRHQSTKTCKAFAMRVENQNKYKCNKVAAESVKFTVFDEQIEQVQEFKYLGRPVTDTDDDLKAVLHNLTKAMRSWGNIHRLLSQDKKRDVKIVTSIYRSIVLSQLLYGSETWVVSPKLIKILEVFHRLYEIPNRRLHSTVTKWRLDIS